MGKIRIKIGVVPTILLITLLIGFFSLFLIYFFHETGHAIMATMLGYKIALFSPFNTSDRGLVVVELPINIHDTDLILLLALGSFFTFSIGIIFLFISMKIRNCLKIKFSTFLLGTVFISDLFVYILTDLFIYKEGDWYKIFKISQFILLVFFIIAILGSLFSAKCIKDLYNYYLEEDTDEIDYFRLALEDQLYTDLESNTEILDQILKQLLEMKYQSVN